MEERGSGKEGDVIGWSVEMFKNGWRVLLYRCEGRQLRMVPNMHDKLNNSHIKLAKRRKYFGSRNFTPNPMHSPTDI